MKTIKAIGVIGALGTLLVAVPALAQTQPSAAWVPGTDPMPRSMLMQFPCHSEEEPCSKIPAPEIQRVTFKAPLNGDRERGKKIAINLRWGNCIACHSLPDGLPGGTVGPDLTDFKSRSPDLQETYQRIWDVRVFNPTAHMPIYGPNKVLDDQDIRDVMAYILSGK